MLVWLRYMYQHVTQNNSNTTESLESIQDQAGMILITTGDY